MATSEAKENILKRIRQALSNPVPLPFPQSEGTNSVYVASEEDNAVIFAEEFSKLQGKFAFCADEKELLSLLQLLVKEKGWDKVYCKDEKLLPIFFPAIGQPYDSLSACDVSITGCEYLVARTGTIVLSAAQQEGRTASVYAPVHICIAYTSQLLYDVKDALVSLKEKYGNSFPSFVTFASGPSRTADIEKTLVTGVHGPKEVFCFLVDV
ncbi:LUD domain-containing protein [Ferruginibacter sp. HRS2-29]|uniref:LutC/YkgG family protein n=1 Tax=Ferruginibacter sp. HRS2-29 TaxID=2487334 RepID=UPI0020CC2717|nr:LUD domain-containing protein [Ferruginibacter sp. HRS2-29]MCP9752851.1 lactate utilization protein B/C [Ferruginibacter sp. HRS2-29]